MHSPPLKPSSCTPSLLCFCPQNLIVWFLVENKIPPGFVNNQSKYDQALVEMHLATSLDRLGHHNNGACPLHFSPTQGVSNKSLVNFRSRAFMALRDRLCNYILWSRVRENEITLSHFSKFGFPWCVGLIDNPFLPYLKDPKRTMNATTIKNPITLSMLK